jgi:hypothetical protein
MSKKKRIPLKGGDEFDAFTNKERIYTYLFRSGVLKKIKQQYNKRFRKAGKQEIQKG